MKTKNAVILSVVEKPLALPFGQRRRGATRGTSLHLRPQKLEVLRLRSVSAFASDGTPLRMTGGDDAPLRTPWLAAPAASRLVLGATSHQAFSFADRFRTSLLLRSFRGGTPRLLDAPPLSSA